MLSSLHFRFVALGLFLSGLAGCGSGPVKSTRLLPLTHFSEAPIAQTDDVWTASISSGLASYKARLSIVGEYLVAHVDIKNEASEGPLQILSAMAYDADKTILKSEHSSDVSRQYSDKASENRSRAADAAADASASAREARILQAVNSNGAWGAALGDSLAAAVTSSIYGERANQLQRHADFIRSNGYQNTPIPPGFSNRGLISFIISDRIQPFTLALELTNRIMVEKVAFRFGKIDGQIFWDSPALMMSKPEYFLRMLTYDEQRELIRRARAARDDSGDFEALRERNPAQHALIDWLSRYAPYESIYYR